MEKCLLGKDESILPQARERWLLDRDVSRGDGWKDDFSAEMKVSCRRRMNEGFSVKT
jgi:hypothetical protein